MADKMPREEIKEFIFDDLLEFLEETGATNSITPEEIAEILDETPSRVKGCMEELVQEDVLEKFQESGETWYRFTEAMVEQLIEEMIDSGWVPPESSDDEE